MQSAKPAESKAEQKLNMEEFANLIFSHSEMLDVDLKKLQPATIEQYPASTGSMRSQLMTEMSDFPQPKTIYEDDYIVLDQKQVPQNVIENIESKMIRMNRRIKKKYGTQEKFEEAFKKEVEADKNGNVSVDQLKDFILSQCEEDIINRKVSKRDVEGFLSAFNYNMYGATNATDACNLIFTKDNEI